MKGCVDHTKPLSCIKKAFQCPSRIKRTASTSFGEKKKWETSFCFSPFSRKVRFSEVAFRKERTQSCWLFCVDTTRRQPCGRFALQHSELPANCGRADTLAAQARAAQLHRRRGGAAMRHETKKKKEKQTILTLGSSRGSVENSAGAPVPSNPVRGSAVRRGPSP